MTSSTDRDPNSSAAAGAAVLGTLVGALAIGAGMSGSWFAIIPAVIANALICAAATSPIDTDRPVKLTPGQKVDVAGYRFVIQGFDLQLHHHGQPSGNVRLDPPDIHRIDTD